MRQHEGKPLPLAEQLRFPDDFVANVEQGIPLPEISTLDQPLLYSKESIRYIAWYLLHHQTLYANDSIKANIHWYCQLFGLNIEAYIHPWLTKTQQTVRLQSEVSTNVHCDDIGAINFPTERERLLMHGRFNGWPHAGYIETLILLKMNYPNHEIWVGVDNDHSSICKGQLPFMNQSLRASLLFYTGLIDHLIYLNPPESNEDSWRYWSDIYAIQGHLDPSVIAMPGDEFSSLKEEDMSVRTRVQYIEVLDHKRLHLHQTEFRNGLYTPEQVQHQWRRVRRLKKLLR